MLLVTIFLYLLNLPHFDNVITSSMERKSGKARYKLKVLGLMNSRFQLQVFFGPLNKIVEII